MFKFIYFVVAILIYILALPYLIFKSRQTKYKDAIPSRFFLKNNSRFLNNGIWFHCCSFGEVNAVKPIIDKISDTNTVNLSVITNTGYENAKAITKNTRYLPFEILLPFWITKQKVLVVLEAELWFMLFLIAKSKKTKTVLLNARISDKSYLSYKKFGFLYKQIFKNIDKVFAQSEIDKKRLEEFEAKNVEVIGNIKLSNIVKTTKKLQKNNEKQLIVAGSTHKDEEKLILEAYDKSMGTLVIVPRHPERFDEVDELISQFAKNKGFSYHKYSNKSDFSSDVVLVDKLGELVNIYAISDVVLLCGSFKDKIGGHNPIEPACFDNTIISGKYIFNQKPLYECIDGIYMIENEDLRKYLQQASTLKKAKMQKVGNIEPFYEYIKENK